MTVRNIVVLKKLTSTTGVLQVAQSADTYRLPRDLVFKTGVSTSEVADGSSAVGFKYSTPAYSTAGGKVAQWLNGDTEVLSISYDGWLAPSAGIALTPIAAPTYVEGLLFYDDTDKCPSYYNDEADVTINLGQENVLRVRNVSGSTIADGSVCYISGSTGEFAQIDLAIADAAVPPIIGVATHSIEDTSFGYICTFGIVRGIDTSAFSVGDVLYLSDSVAGGFTTTKPTLPTEAVEIGTVIKVAAAGKIFVSINHVYLHEISDDPTPTLGGNLDCDGNNITNVANLEITGTHNLQTREGYAFSDEETALTTGTKATFRMPNYATTLLDVSVSMTDAPTGSTAVFDLNEAGTSVLSTKISVDAGETTSETAATPPVISDSALAANALMTIDVDQVGSVVAGAGGKLYYTYKRA